MGFRTAEIVGKHPQFVALVNQAILKEVSAIFRSATASARAKQVAYAVSQDTESHARKIAPLLAAGGLGFDSTDAQVTAALKAVWEKELGWILRVDPKPGTKPKPGAL